MGDVTETEEDVLESTKDMRRHMSSTEPAAEASGSETANVGELADGVADDGDDVGIREDGEPEEAEEHVELKDEVINATEEATEEDNNPEQSCSAKPDVDSRHPERFISKTRDDHARKRESRSLRYLKVPQASIVTQLK